MIYDAHGNLWVTPMRIGFRREIQRGSNEPADAVTFPVVSPTMDSYRVIQKPDADLIYRR